MYIQSLKIKMFSNFLHCSLQVPLVMVHHAEYVMAYHACNGKFKAEETGPVNSVQCSQKESQSKDSSTARS